MRELPDLVIRILEDSIRVAAITALSEGIRLAALDLGWTEEEVREAFYSRSRQITLPFD